MVSPFREADVPILPLFWVNQESVEWLFGDTVNSRLADTLLLRTAAESPAKINYRPLTKIISRYCGLSLLRTNSAVPRMSAIKGVDCIAKHLMLIYYKEDAYIGINAGYNVLFVAYIAWLLLFSEINKLVVSIGK